MNRAILIALACATALCACADVPITPTAGSFDWLAGCWHLDRDDGSAYDEMWLPPTANGSLGAGRELKGGRTVSWEFQRIELRRDSSIVFVVQPSGQPAAEFRMVQHEPGKLAFENPQHDFPTRVEYRYIDLNAIAARASGSQDGQPRVIDYPLHRVDCQG